MMANSPTLKPSSSRRPLCQIVAVFICAAGASLIFLRLTWTSSADVHFSRLSSLPLSRWTRPPLESTYPPVHLLFPLDKKSHGDRSCRTLLAALVHGYTPLIVNWDLEGTPDEQYSAKISGIHYYIARNLTNVVDGDDLVFMSDSFDVWLQQSPKALVRRFQELDSKIAIGIDIYCWPNDPNSPECLSAPNSTLPDAVFGPEGAPKYANSGTVMGTLTDMRDLYEELNDLLRERPTVNDQAFFNELLPHGRFALDYSYRLFWTTAGPGVGYALGTRYPIDGDYLDTTIPYAEIPTMAHHSLTGEIPVALHFNADSSKSWYMEGDVFWSKLWWTSPQPRFRNIVLERMDKARIVFPDGSRKKWEEICPMSLLPA